MQKNLDNLTLLDNNTPDQDPMTLSKCYNKIFNNFAFFHNQCNFEREQFDSYHVLFNNVKFHIQISLGLLLTKPR